MNKLLCLIIGFGPGNGFAIAQAFGALGHPLALLSRNPDRHSALLKELETKKFNFKSYAADAGNESSLKQAVSKATHEMGEVGILIYNAIAPTFIPPTELTHEQLVADFRVNIAGALTATLQVLPEMKKREKGTILFTGGGWAFQPWHVAASPGIGKAGLRNLTFTLAQELTSTGVHVATVTICGEVKPGTHFDPDKIAQAYVTLHQQEPGHFETEIIYKE